MSRYICCFVILFSLMLNLQPGKVSAQECTAIKEQIKKQRNLLQKKELLSQALTSCPKDAEVCYLCAYTDERLRKYESAMAHYLKATELDKTYAKAYFGLGDIYMILGNADAAIRAFKTGLQLSPQNGRAQASLELAEIKRKSESGGDITSAEFIRVMQESKSKETTAGALDGPLLRMQIHFRIDSSQLTDDALEQLAVVGQALSSKALQGQKFEISGHTDNSGPAELNLQLSKERAEQVKKYLCEHYTVAPENLLVAYFGDTRPAAPNSTAEYRALNRRVEFKKL